MARFSEYVDSESSYLPGEVYSAGLSEYNLMPQSKIDYMKAKQFKFKPKDRGDEFQRFLALQSNPSALFSSTVQLPDTPFGNLSQYMGV